MSISHTNSNLGEITLASGVVVKIEQQAHLAGSNESPRYEAAAAGSDGNDYLVTWVPYENYQDLMAEDDESACCDWDDYTVTSV